MTVAAATLSLALMLALPPSALHAPTRAAAAVPLAVVPPVLVEPSEAVVAVLDAYEAEHPYKEDEVVGVIEAPRRAETRAEIEQLICQYDWPCSQAIRVANCESTMRPTVVNASGHMGLYQMNPRYHAWRVGGDASRLLIAEENVRAAHGLWADSGNSWRAWSCRP
jgi:hypothetical protein